MLTKTLLTTAALSGLALAAPAPVAPRQSVSQFGMIATHSTSAVHLQSVNANGGKFWVGKPTATYCPIAADECPADLYTVLATAGTGTVSMSVEVPGGQQVYVDPSDGSLSFTQAHSAYLPPGAELSPFTYTPQQGPGYVGTLSFGTGTEGFFACPVNGTSPYQILSLAAGTAAADCIGINLATSEYNGTVAAWQYT